MVPSSVASSTPGNLPKDNVVHLEEGHRVMERIPDKLWHAAVHAAGHAVVARVLGLSGGRPSLVPDFEEETAGVDYMLDVLQAWEWSHLHPNRNQRAFWHGKIIAHMAGSEAECEIIGSCAGGDKHDRRRCDLIAGDLKYSDDWPKRAVRLRRFARQLAKRHRSAVVSFANQLIAADELDELLAR
jgi:hypothetical protein